MTRTQLLEIYQAIEQELKSSLVKKKFAVFDFDNTCIYNDIAEATLAYFCEHGLLRNNHLMPRGVDGGGVDEKYHSAVFEKYHGFLDKGRIQEAYEFCAKMLAGYSPQEIYHVVDRVLKYEGKASRQKRLFGRTIARGLRVKPNTEKLMKYVSNAGMELWIVSASPKVIVERGIQTFFKKYDCRCIAIETKLNGSILTDELVLPTPTYAGKQRCIQKFIGRTDRPILGVGDSNNDLPMLEYSLIKVVSDRGNELARLARERKWYLI